MTSLCRKCPQCPAIIEYTSIRSLKNSIKRNTKCKECNRKRQTKVMVAYHCPTCNKQIKVASRNSLLRAMSKGSKCRSCANRDTATLAWSNGDYRNKITSKSNNPSKELRQILSDNSKLQWQCADYRNTVILAKKKLWESDDYRAKMAAIYASKDYKDTAVARAVALWADDEYRQRVIAACTDAATSDIAIDRSRRAALAQWADPKFRAKMAIVLGNQPKVSNIQRILYSFLDDLKVAYFREYNDRPDDVECKIGPYCFDCVIPRVNQQTLLIECQGDYWHSTPDAQKRDAAKMSYIVNNFPNYCVRYIWEHEFYNRDKVIESLKYWLGIDQSIVDYNFDDVIVKLSPATDYRDLLVKYHYLPNAGKGGRAIGAYLNNILIAVAVFSPPVRQNTNFTDTLEISRLCVHPSYRKRNMVSWLLARSERLVSCSTLITYADTTFNHFGSAYKAAGFVLDGETKPDYWYVNATGWVMHKKTLYNRAVNLSLTEKDFANQFGYQKVYGGTKLRFIKHLRNS